MRKQFLVIILAAVMFVCLLPANAALAANATSVRVGGVTLNDGEYTTDGTIKTSAAPTPTVSSYAYFKGGVLYLKDFSYTGAGIGSIALNCERGDLTIDLTGASKLTQNGNSAGTSMGVYVFNNLTIQGSGSLTAASGKATMNSTGISTSSLTVLSGTLIGIGGDAGSDRFSNGIGANTNGSITVSGGSVTAIGGTVGGSYGISNGFLSGNGIVLTGGSITARGGAATYSRSFSVQPTFGTNPTWYQWRLNSGGAYTLSSDTAYTWNAAHTYVNIVPAQSAAPIPKTGDSSLPGLWLGLAVLSALGLAGSAVLGRGKRREKTE